jgi:anti-sigma regulatory factor (Ser/Thr protein kinase)
VTDARRFRCQPEAVTAARRFVREVLSDRPPELVDAAELMASELATNCVRHAHTGFEMTIHSDGQIRVEVRDTGEGRPRPLSPTSREISGRGLRIVEAMSDAWGVIPTSNGKAVWFTLPQPGASSEAASSRRSRHPQRTRRGVRTPRRTEWDTCTASSLGEVHVGPEGLRRWVEHLRDVWLARGSRLADE